MNICKQCSGTGYHSRWCPDRGAPLFLPKPATRIEWTGNIQVHHKVKP